MTRNNIVELSDYKIILVIGGGGFIGRHLVETLLREGARVRIMDRFKPFWIDSSVEFVEGDFTAFHMMDHVMDGCGAVVHLASTTIPGASNEDPQFDAASNLVGAIGLLELAAKKEIRNFIFVSSGGTVYGVPEYLPVSELASTNPLCSYGIVKLSIEKYIQLFCRLYGISGCSLRFANPYGAYQRPDKGQGVVAAFCRHALNRVPLEIWGDGSVVRDFVYIQDAVDALVCALRRPCTGDVFNVGSGCGTSLVDLVSTLESIIGENLDVMNSSCRPFDVPAIYLDIAKVRRELGWEPRTDLHEGLRKTLLWQEKHNTF